MSDRTGATVGFVFAGIATAATLRPWPTENTRRVALGIAAVVTLVFLLRRYDYLDRRVGSPVAGIGSVGAVATGLAGIAPGGAILAPSAAAVAGLGACVGAWTDWTAVPRDRFLDLTRRGATATVIGIAGIAAIIVWGGVLVSLVSATGVDALSPVVQTLLSTLALGIGTASVAAVYLRWSDRGVGFVDARVPDRRGWAYVLGGTVALLASNLAISAFFGWLGLESTTHSLLRAARDTPEILLVLVPLSYLVVGPGEELLYRNVIQKSLSEAFSRWGAVVVASVIFASVHLPAYADPEASALALLNTLSIVFALSLILGTVYDRTGNLTVSALVHGSFNAIAFAVTYAEITGLVG